MSTADRVIDLNAERDKVKLWKDVRAAIEHWTEIERLSRKWGDWRMETLARLERQRLRKWYRLITNGDHTDG